MNAPRATYRLQLRGGFDLDQAAALADYLAALGVSHLYTSPLLQAERGSAHGYDVVDHRRIDRDLGGEEALQRLGDRLAEHGLGLVLDVVPNHMAVGRDNAWWWDVLENGPCSRFAAFFDVDWDPPESRLRNLVLVPILDDHYGRALEKGELLLVRDRGSFRVRWRDHELPVAPRSLDDLLRSAADRCGSQELAFLADAFGRLPLATATDYASVARRHRDKEVLRRALAGFLATRPDAAAAVDESVARLNADADALHELLERQNWRVARWRAGERDLGYRRFFDVDHLAGLRVEDPVVFEATHHWLLERRRAGAEDGIRVDHIDGLRDPTRYLERLRAALPESWISVEKVLSPGERLPDWPVAGTTGYDFLNRVGGLFVDPAGEKALGDLFASFAGEPRDFAAIAREKKDLVLRKGLAADLNRLTMLTLSVCERHRRYRDFTRHELHEALRDCIVHFPVYRSYVRTDGSLLREEDVAAIRSALRAARDARPDLDAELFDFLEAILLRRLRGELEDEVLLRFQQLTGPAQAMGVEDTAFYGYHRLVSLNEVGGDPDRFGTAPAAFHAASSEAQRCWPTALLATSTHDCKRGEDVRARLHLLSEIPEGFAEAVRRWSSANARHRSGDLPDRGIELLFYQTLLGAWPIPPSRVHAYLEKAAREAKQHTSWTDPCDRYEAALHHFVEGALYDASFLAEVDRFAAQLVAPGRVNSLAQTLVKLAAPGVPDLYQGCELWESNLVDPDNRRPVDFARRRALLAELDALDLASVRARANEGLPKLWLIRQALDLRRRRPEWFGPAGDYEPLDARGDCARHVVAFSRAGRAVALAPRLVIGLERAGGFGETWIDLPPGCWRDVLSLRRQAPGRRLVAELLADFPVALLEDLDA